MNAPRPELIVVMPVHNEEGVIASVLEEWMAVLAALGIAFQIRLYDDGSTDRTSELVRKAAGSDPRLVLIEKANSGHGATILRGYRESGDAEWLFQTDSDDEMPALPFRELWRLRNEADFVIGNRQSRAAPWSRKIVTRLSQWTVWLLFGGRIRDVNSPYRLMRNSLFRELFQAIPGDTFAPNLIISGFASKSGLRVASIEVPVAVRRPGSALMKRWSLFAVALRAFGETIAFRISGRMPILMKK